MSVMEMCANGLTKKAPVLRDGGCIRRTVEQRRSGERRVTSSRTTTTRNTKERM